MTINTEIPQKQAKHHSNIKKWIIATSKLEKANLLNASLVKNFNHSLPVLTLSDLPHTSPNSCPTNFLCTEEEVYSLLSTLDTTKANGHDDISARMLKETALSGTKMALLCKMEIGK